MTGDTEDLIKYRISRSRETLIEAETMIKNGYWNASVNRIYYSCFYAVSGLMLRNGIESNSHKGIRQMFGLHFVQSGLVWYGAVWCLRRMGLRAMACVCVCTASRPGNKPGARN